MKKTILIHFILLSIFISSCSKDNTNPTPECNLENPSASVSESEVELIKHMREEEKLAKDVYDYLYAKYGLNIFKNISKSEQSHINQVICLLNQYNIPDPSSTQAGVFANPNLQELYNNLILQGDISLTEALKVGATIEDVDIYDLMNYMNQTQNPAILQIYSNLTCGSRNHLRAFISTLQTTGENYTPQFITTELYNEILSNSKEYCN